MRSKVSIIFDNFDHEVKTLIMRSKVQKYKNGTIIEFQSHEQFVMSAIMRSKIFEFIKLHLWLCFSPNY